MFFDFIDHSFSLNGAEADRAGFWPGLADGWKLRLF
jgi:hypothetical protein